MTADIVDRDGKGDVIADINYFPSLGTPIPTSAWKKRYLGVGDDHTRAMTIRDLRSTIQDHNLETNGFKFLRLTPRQRVDSLSTEETIRREYYPELEHLAKSLTGASTAFVFNHVVRAHSSPSDKGILDSHGRWQDIPAGHPHVDYCGDPDFLQGTEHELNLPSHVASLYATSSRYAYLGAWRPLKIVFRDPLAVCDATTVPSSDYQLRLREFRSGIKSGNYVMSHAREEQQHQWYYMSAMKPDEMLIFKGFDTEQSKPGWRCPHTAFRLPGSDQEPPRESIEARIVCFWN
ncbi:uncharacterized protein EKO05_0002577 [Ascochyta rabiei]|uniref:Uncharacterized protein n=1 Tax=Didymella rabiei TaxID=5454 RepID=A0A163IJR0_DIDRA|nr:uncharacterized protein EKO05_0002577 [Ascochyta rabiei]KZM25783.1 hypothetical protein ST47_g3056 [Ascochyta rabiei]UPX11999.1 hypothetical protein EKO05_0002577 [Ascochyta rabiei]